MMMAAARPALEIGGSAPLTIICHAMPCIQLYTGAVPTSSSSKMATAFVVLLLAIAPSAVAPQPVDLQPVEVDDPVTAAISKCRERLKDIPSEAPFAFPKTQYRLALLLESRLPPRSEDDYAAARIEIASLYSASAHNETHGFEPSVRVLALTKGASLLIEVGSEKSKLAAEDMLKAAIDISGEELDGSNPQALSLARASVFEKLSLSYLGRASGDNERALLENALGLCSKCLELAPKEPVCDEYRGVVLRRLYRTRIGKGFAKSSILSSTNNDAEPNAAATASAAKDVHDAYDAAAKKSHEAAILASLTPGALATSRYPCGTLRFKYGAHSKKFPTSSQLRQQTTEDQVIHLSSLWTRLVRHIVLAAAAAREAGLRENEDRHISYGLFLMSHLTISDFIASDVQADFLSNVGIRHKVRGEKKEAIRYFRAAIEVNPNDGHALVQLASLGDEHAAATTELSEEYVSNLFDGYSERFEKELVEDLDYKGHLVVADGIDRYWENGDNTGDVHMVDLGCGTGLLGKELRQKIGSQIDALCTSQGEMRNLIIQGIDLSDRMVDISRARTVIDTSGTSVAVYNDVENIDAATFLYRLDSRSIDVITASDVFIYVGALDNIFRECSRVLKKGGLLGFTVEIPPREAKSGDDGLLLLKSGRFGHTKTYIQKLANSIGLSLLEWKEEILRKQGKDDVEGAVVTLQLN